MKSLSNHVQEDEAESETMRTGRSMRLVAVEDDVAADMLPYVKC